MINTELHKRQTEFKNKKTARSINWKRLLIVLTIIVVCAGRTSCLQNQLPSDLAIFLQSFALQCCLREPKVALRLSSVWNLWGGAEMDRVDMSWLFGCINLPSRRFAGIFLLCQFDHNVNKLTNWLLSTSELANNYLYLCSSYKLWFWIFFYFPFVFTSYLCSDVCHRCGYWSSTTAGESWSSRPDVGDSPHRPWSQRQAFSFQYSSEPTCTPSTSSDKSFVEEILRTAPVFLCILPLYLSSTAAPLCLAVAFRGSRWSCGMTLIQRPENFVVGKRERWRHLI